MSPLPSPIAPAPPAAAACASPTCESIQPPGGFSPVVLGSFQMLTTTGGTPIGAFPNGGGSFAILEQDRQQLTSIAFTVPSVRTLLGHFDRVTCEPLTLR